MSVLSDIASACVAARGPLDSALDATARCSISMSAQVKTLEDTGLTDIGSAIIIARREFADLHRVAAGFVDRLEAAQESLHSAQHVADTKAAVLAYLTANSSDLRALVRELTEFGVTVRSFKTTVAERLSESSEQAPLVKELGDAATEIDRAAGAIRRVVSETDDGIGQVEGAG